MGMKLVSVYDPSFTTGTKFLFDLLAERTAAQSISHKAMPTYDQHVSFVESRPYGENWYLVYVPYVGFVGSVYLTRQREIGIAILKKYRGQGYGTCAVQALMARFDTKFLANINPANTASISMFKKLHFTHIQNTYCHE